MTDSGVPDGSRDPGSKGQSMPLTEPLALERGGVDSAGEGEAKARTRPRSVATRAPARLEGFFAGRGCGLALGVHRDRSRMGGDGSRPAALDHLEDHADCGRRDSDARPDLSPGDLHGAVSVARGGGRLAHHAAHRRERGKVE